MMGYLVRIKNYLIGLVFSHDSCHTANRHYASSLALLMHIYHNHYTLWIKKVHHRVFVITSPNIDRFPNFFHLHALRKICNKVLINDPTTFTTRRYTTLSNINDRNLARSLRSGSLAVRQIRQSPDIWQATRRFIANFLLVHCINC